MYAQQDIQKGNSMGAAGIGIASGLINGAINIGLNSINNDKAEERMYDQARLNYDYGELAAQNAFARQKGLIGQYFTPEAQLRQLREAGLSPSQMYGGNGSVVGTSQSSAPQGSGAAGPSPLPVSPYSLDVATMLKAIAETKQAEADANLKNAQAKTEQYNQAKLDLENKAQELENEINLITKDTKIETIRQKLTNLENQAELTYWQGKNAEIDYDFKSENFHNALEEQVQKNGLLAQQILESKSGQKLNEEQSKWFAEQTKWYGEQVWIKYQEMLAKYDQIDAEYADQELRKELANIDKEVRMDFNRRLSENAQLMADVQERGQWFDLAGDVVHGGVEIAKQYANPIGTTVEKTAKTIMDGKGNVKGRETTNRQITTQKGR